MRPREHELDDWRPIECRICGISLFDIDFVRVEGRAVCLDCDFRIDREQQLDELDRPKKKSKKSRKAVDDNDED